MSSTTHTNISAALVDEEVRTDVLDYFPVITNKKIYYQLLTQHIKYYDCDDDAQQNQTFQDDTFFLNKSSVEWRVPPTVQKRLAMMDTDWNKSPCYASTTKVARSVYAANIESATWHWQEKSKCFPLIETTENHLVFSHPQHERQAYDYAADKTRKATCSHRSARKLALFDITSSSSMVLDVYNNPTPPDYGKEIDTTATTTTVKPTTMMATSTTTAETTAYGNIQNKEADLYHPPPPGGKFHPHREIDNFIQQKRQVSQNIKRQTYY